MHGVHTQRFEMETVKMNSFLQENSQRSILDESGRTHSSHFCEVWSHTFVTTTGKPKKPNILQKCTREVGPGILRRGFT